MTDVGNSADSSGNTSEPHVATSGPDPEFVQLFTRSQRQIYLFVLSLVPNPVDAEEILQETNLVIWRKMAQFAAGTNFLGWAYQIANLEVLKYRERKHREKLQFSEEFIERVAAETIGISEMLESRRQALMTCIGKLRSADRELVEERYSVGENGRSVARKLGRPSNSVYQSLGRIRRTLMECISRRMSAESLP